MFSIKRTLQRLKRGYRLKNEREPADSVPEATVEQNVMLTTAARYSMSSKPRLWATMQAMQHIARERIDGDIVECGVWKGGNLVLCGLMAKHLGITRKIWGFDTFEGMSAPTDEDVRVGTNKTVHERWQAATKDGVTDWCFSPYQEVEQNFRTEVGTNNLTLVKGKVEDTLTQPQNLPDKIALLRLDTDWYESTKVELEVLYPRLQKGGVLIIDDYGHWAGAKKAVDEYFAATPIWLHRIDYTGRLYIKT
jgi:hypothetical protein